MFLALILAFFRYFWNSIKKNGKQAEHIIFFFFHVHANARLSA